MSGRKQVTIDSSEYQWLQNQHAQLSFIRADLPATIEANLRSQAAELQNRLAPLEQRQQDFIRDIQGLSEELRESEIRTAQHVEQQHSAMRRAIQEADERHAFEIGRLGQDLRETEDRLEEEIAETEERLREENQRLMAEQDARLRSLVTTERQARQQQVQNLQTQIQTLVSGLQANDQRKMQIARTRAQDAQIILDAIAGRYRHEQFAPGQLSKLQRELGDSRQSLAAGMPEAALATAQSVYNGLSDLRLELEQLEREWETWRGRALASTRELLSEAARNRQVHGLDLQGQPVDMEIEVDWWTDGKLNALQKEVEHEIVRLEESRNLTTIDLRKVVEERAPALQQKLAEVLAEARLAVISSQLRYSIADLVVQALEDQGFDIDGGVYQGQDMRNGYYAKVLHPDGGEVVVAVTPDARQLGQNLLEINSYDEGMVSEPELLQRTEEINRSLRERNESLQISRPQIAGKPNQDVRDLERVRRSQTRKEKR